MNKDQIIQKVKEILLEITCEDEVDVEETLSFYDMDDDDQELSDEIESEFNIKCPTFTGSSTVDEFCDRIVEALEASELETKDLLDTITEKPSEPEE